MTEEKNQATNPQTMAQGRGIQHFSLPIRKFILATAVLALCFAAPLFQLVRFSVRSELYSYIPLVPLICGYLIWSQRKIWPKTFRPATGPAAIFSMAGLAGLIVWLAAGMPARPAENYLAPVILTFLFLFAGVISWFLGREFLKTFAFPLALLVFFIPVPTFLRDGIDVFLQHGSAAVANALFAVSGLPFYRDGLLFHLPGITIQVATECSGIHSTIALLITSLLAGYVFLRKPWSRALLALVVIPLALLRNGFRIFVIGQLCAQIGPQMIDSPIHHRGGPLFFTLSLIPFFLLLVFLIKLERRQSPSKSK